MKTKEPGKAEASALQEKAQGAFLGAAAGDALGWPQEINSRRIDKPSAGRDREAGLGLQQWVREAGGRFYAHEEAILAGEYSDDTQLLLCTARSLLHGSEWWTALTSRELPSWTLYERGGGRATKRAAERWLAGREPWSSSLKPNERKRYFDAGGNGAAMRILPHCIFQSGEPDFHVLATSILANAICTHGHPRALVGGLAYGFALWKAFRQEETLDYGALVEMVLSGAKAWSLLPDLGDLPSGWLASANKTSNNTYGELWQRSVTEMLELIGECQKGLGSGALSVDKEVLTRLGCFDRKINGAGTVAASASIFLASRYAADPYHGVLEAAFAHGADTDTIASMTGALLGAITGADWTTVIADQVQDSTCLKQISQRLARHELMDEVAGIAAEKVTKARLDSFRKSLPSCARNKKVVLPDGRKAVVAGCKTLSPLTESAKATSWQLATEDGQTLYVKKLSRRKAGSNDDTPLFSRSPVHVAMEGRSLDITEVGVKLLVRNMPRVREFYERVLGLEVTSSSDSLLVLANVLALAHYPRAQESGRDAEGPRGKARVFVWIQTGSLQPVYDNVCRSGTTIVKPLSKTGGKRFFRCLDPERNVIEVSQTENP